MQDMNDWLVTVLISVRDMASEAGKKMTAERLDDVILVAVDECEKTKSHQLRIMEVDEQVGRSEMVHDFKPGTIRRYH